MRRTAFLSPLTNTVWDYKLPANLYTSWFFGSVLGILLVNQIVSGFFLSMHYVPHVDYAFESVVHINRDVSGGAILRGMHVGGATYFFFFLYLHIGRGLYYGSYRNIKAWLTGILLFILLMAISFLGYVLPWGQMSYWAAVVITNLIGIIPYLGITVVEWLWGGFGVDQPTLNRFYSLHFILPFVMCFLVMAHVYFIHEKGSSNPSNVYDEGCTVECSFHPYYISSDILMIMFMGLLMVNAAFFSDWDFVPVENWEKANPMVTPHHIKPEWYFLYLYAILRSQETKMGGVMCMISSITTLVYLSFIPSPAWQGGAQYSNTSKFIYWAFIGNMFLLFHLGAQPAEEPYMWFTQFCSANYFGFLYLFYWSLMSRSKDLMVFHPQHKW
nr:cytochrome b [Glottidia pyramidata]